MAQDQLYYKITADTSGFVRGINSAISSNESLKNSIRSSIIMMQKEQSGFKAFSTAADIRVGATNRVISSSNKAAKASRKVTGSTKKSGLAFTQLAYAMDDAQYGFRGVQNNLQAMAVQMGVGGPWIIAITAAVIALGYLIEKTDVFTGATNAAVKESQKFIDTLAEELNLIDKKFKTQEEGLKQIKINNKRLERLNEIEKKQIQNGKALQSVFVEERAALEKKNETIAYLLGLQSSRADADDAEKKATQKKTAALKKYNAEIAKLKDQEDIARNTVGMGYTPDADPGLFDVFSDRGVAESIINADDVEYIDETVQDINDLLSDLGSPLAGLSDTLAAEFLAIDEGLRTTAENSQLFANAFIGAFESAATQGGNFLENLAKGMLSSLGSILIQLGTAAIMAGIAKNAIVPGSGAKSIKSGALVTGVGIAMKAGGSAIGGRGGAAGASAASSTGTAIGGNSSLNSSRNQGAGNSGRLTGEVKLRGQDLLVALQSANDVRNTF